MKTTYRVLNVLVAVEFIVLAGLVAFLALGLYLQPKDTGPKYIVIPPFSATATPYGFVTATPTRTPKPQPTTRTPGAYRPATFTPGGPQAATLIPVPAPSVSLVSPSAGQGVPAGQPVSIQANVTAAAGLVHTDILVDGALLTSIINPVYGGTSMTVTQSWTPSAAGTHTITVLAYDRLFQVSPAATVSVLVTVPATLAAWIAQPASPTGRVVYMAGDSIQLSYWGSAVHGVSRLELWVDGQRVSTNTNSSQSTTMNVQQTWSSTTIGMHNMFVRVYDTLNQSADSITLQIGLTDRNPPSVTLVSPANGAQLQSGQTIQVNVSASDSKGIMSIQLWIDGGLYGTWNSSAYAGDSTVNTSLAWTQPAVGSHSLYLVARDSVGLTTTSPTIVVTVLAAQPPTATPTETQPAPPTATPTLTQPPPPTGTSTLPPTATHTATPTATETKPAPTGTPTATDTPTSTP